MHAHINVHINTHVYTHTHTNVLRLSEAEGYDKCGVPYLYPEAKALYAQTEKSHWEFLELPWLSLPT